MAAKLTYLSTPGTVDTLFKKIKQAAVPDHFDKDFIEKTLNIKGGTGTACIPFLKRLGLLNSDGTPSESYRSFRNDRLSGGIVANAMKKAYQEVFQSNENAQKLSDEDLKAVLVQVTGLPADSRAVELTVGTFKFLKKHAKFDASATSIKETEQSSPAEEESLKPPLGPIGLSYTFYLNLPNTNDISVFNAIFKALRDNMLVK